MKNPFMILDRGDRYALVSIIISFIVWWYFIGSKKYGTKGMR